MLYHFIYVDSSSVGVPAVFPRECLALRCQGNSDLHVVGDFGMYAALCDYAVSLVPLQEMLAHKVADIGKVCR